MTNVKKRLIGKYMYSLYLIAECLEEGEREGGGENVKLMEVYVQNYKNIKATF